MNRLEEIYLKTSAQKIETDVMAAKRFKNSITKNYLYKLKKDIKNMFVNGVFWRRLKYVGYNYCQ